MRRNLDSLVSLAAAAQAERVAALWQLFVAECVDMGSPLDERQKLAFTKCLCLQMDGTKLGLGGLFEMDALVSELGERILRDTNRPGRLADAE